MPGRIRTLKPEWLDDERIAMASSDARVLSVALILLADDWGNGRCHVTTVAPRIFPPHGESPEELASSSRRFRESFDELSRLNYCGLYQLDGQSYFSVRNWPKHQKVDHPSKPLVPGPPQGFWDEPRVFLSTVSRDNRDSLDSDLRPRPTTNDQDLASSQAAKPSRKPVAEKPKPEPSPVSGYKELVEHYFLAFEEHRKTKPCFGSREGKAIRDLLEKCGGSLDRAKSVITNAYTDKFWREKATILSIAKDPSQFLGGSTAQSSNFPDKLQFSERHRGLCKRASLDINLEWTRFAAESRAKGAQSADWSESFVAHLASVVSRVERSAAYRANGPPSRQDAPGRVDAIKPTQGGQLNLNDASAATEARPGAIAAAIGRIG